MFKKFFLDHPDSVGETYLEHMEVASGFGARLAFAAFCCFVHAIVPGLFCKTGSRMINQLYSEMGANRRRNALPHGLLSYEI